MSQQTTREFSARLRMSLDGSRRAPPKEVGRQAWLRDRLAKEKNIEVSPNSVHKWVTGASRPREDNIRAIAEILGVDEIWLSMGRSPNLDLAPSPGSKVEGSPAGATPGALILAGLAQRAGRSVIFAGNEDAASLYLDTGRGSVGVIVAEFEERRGSLVAVIPEPVASNRIVAVISEGRPAIRIYDLTDEPRQNFGGYSVMSLTRQSDDAVEIDGGRGLVRPVESVEELA